MNSSELKKNYALLLYKHHHEDKDDERYGLFLILGEKFNIKSALYPGSFVHITPSFIFSKVVYIDTENKANEFFNDPTVYELISKKKLYKGDSVIDFHHKDYRENIEEHGESFDLLISQHAGFISQYCKKYLKIGEFLVVNNSHGDASMSSIDHDYKLVGVFNKRKDQYSFSDKNLDTYFIPKKKMIITKDYLEKKQMGIGYTKSASNYLFRRIN